MSWRERTNGWTWRIVSPGLAGCRQNQGEPVLAGCRQNLGLAGCRQNQGEPVSSGGMDGVCETHTRHATSSIRREQEEQQESCARRDLVTGGPSDSVLVPPCESLEISWRESRAGIESQAAPRSEALAVPVVGNGDGGRRSWEQDGDSAYRTENQQGSELTGTRSAEYATIVRTTPARGSSGSNTQTTFSSERPRPVTFTGPPSRPTDRDPSATFTMVSEGFSNSMGVTPVCLRGESVQQLPEHMPLPSGRSDLGASMHYQPQLGNVPPWPPPGGAELMGRVNTVPCLGTGDQWGGGIVPQAIICQIAVVYEYFCRLQKEGGAGVTAATTTTT